MSSTPRFPFVRPEFVRRAELEVDLRLLPLMLEALDQRWMTKPLFAAYLRLAYATGYHDALQEKERGELFRTLGLPVPERQA